MPLGVVIVNRVLPELFTHADEDGVRRAARAGSRDGAARSTPGRAPTAVLDAARLAVSMRRSRSVAPRASCATRSTCRCCSLPYLFVRDHGLRVTRMVAEALGQELA